MTSIFGVQTWCNELVIGDGGDGGRFAEANRETVVAPSNMRALPASPYSL